MRLTRTTLSLTLCGLLSAAAMTGLNAQVTVKNGTVTQGTLSFDAKATLGDFTGTTNTMSGQVTGGELTEVTGWVEAPVNTLKTGKGRRDRDLNKSMETDKYPTMRFDLAGVMPGTTQGDTMAVTLRGNLQIHGVTREVALPGSVVITPTTVRLRTDFPLNVEDYQVGGLSKALGLLRMSKDIVVHVDLTFDQQ